MKNVLILTAYINFRENFAIDYDEKLLYFLKKNKKDEGEWVFDAPIHGRENETCPWAPYATWYIEALCEQNYKLERDYYNRGKDEKIKDVWKVMKAVTVNDEDEMIAARNAFKDILNEVTKMIVETIKEQETKLEKELEALKKKRNEIIEKTF
jgi:hypothetical protein